MMTDCKTMERLWGANVIRKNGFGSFPLLLLRINDYLSPNRRLLENEKRLLFSLVSYRFTGFVVWPNVIDLRRDTGIALVHDIRLTIDALEAKGFIRKVHVPGLTGKKLDHFRYDLKPCVEMLKLLAQSQPKSKRRHRSVTRDKKSNICVLG